MNLSPPLGEQRRGEQCPDSPELARRLEMVPSPGLIDVFYGSDGADGFFRLLIMLCGTKRDESMPSSCSLVTLDIEQDPFMPTVYRTALIITLEEFFGRVQIFGDTLTLAKYCQKELHQ